MSSLTENTPLHPSNTRREATALARVALPSVATGLGYVAMGAVDTVLVGRLGAEALAAVALANSLFFTAVLLFLGCLGSITPLVARARGAQDPARVATYLWTGLALASLLALPPLLAAGHVEAALVALGQDPEVAILAGEYVAGRRLAVLVGPLCGVLGSTLEALGHAAPVSRAVLAANLVNAGLSAALIMGLGPLPAMGVAGAGYGTALARLVQLALIVRAARRVAAGGEDLAPRRPRLEHAAEILALGMPMGLRGLVEVSAYSALSLLAGTLGAEAVAAHVVLLSLGDFGYVSAMGWGRAGSVRVGFHLGREAPRDARRAGRLAMAVGGLAVTAYVALVCSAPARLVAVFTSDPAVRREALAVLGLAAAFWLLDGLQGVAAGVLQGKADTRTPLLASLLGFWLLGVPAAYGLGIRLELGLPGLWLGLASAMALVTPVLTRRALEGPEL